MDFKSKVALDTLNEKSDSDGSLDIPVFSIN